MRKSIWLGLAWTLAVFTTAGCTGQRPFLGDFSGPPVSKTELNRTHVTKPGQQVVAPPPSFPTGAPQTTARQTTPPQAGSPVIANQPATKMNSAPTDPSIQQTQFSDPRRPIATSIDQPPQPLPPGSPVPPPNPFQAPTQPAFDPMSAPPTSGSTTPPDSLRLVTP